MTRRFSPEELASCRCKPEQIAGLAFAADCPLHGSARYEDTAPRLAGEATQGRWHHHPRLMWACVTSGRDGGGEVIVETYARTPNDAALIAYHHPARVVALAAVVARLRERVAGGCQRWCARINERATLHSECDCGHEDDVEALRRLDEEA